MSLPAESGIGRILEARRDEKAAGVESGGWKKACLEVQALIEYVR
jgi:hypothetical protein